MMILSELISNLGFDVTGQFFMVLGVSIYSLLDSRTLKETGLTDVPVAGVRYMFRVYGKMAKVTMTKIEPDDVDLETTERKKERKARERTKEQEREDYIRSLRRTYQTVMEKCVALGADRMLTLTFQENLIEKEVCNRAFSEFVRLCRKRFGTFDYIAVPEQQKRGAIHYHLGLNKFYNWYTILAIWRVAIKKTGTEKTGGIFINKTPCTGSVIRMSRYIAKYFLKEIKNAKDSIGQFYSGVFDKGDKRYYASRNIEKPTIIKAYSRVTFGHWFHDRIIHHVLRDVTNFKNLSKNSEFSFKNWMFQDSKILNFELFAMPETDFEILI